MNRYQNIEKALKKIFRTSKPDRQFVTCLERQLLGREGRERLKAGGDRFGQRIGSGLRVAVQFGFAVVLVLVLVGGLSVLFHRLDQGTSVVATPIRRDTVTISYACYSWMLPELEAWTEAFHREHPDIQVKLVDLDEILAATDDADAETAGDPSYQIYSSADATCWGVWTDSVEQGLVYDLTPFVEGSSGLDQADFYPGMLEAFQWEGGTWGVPFGGSTPLIFYDRGAFDEAGVPYPRPGWTQDDFLAAAQALTLRQADEVTRYGFIADGAPYQAYWFVYARAGSLVDDSNDEAVPVLDSPQAIEAVRWYTDLALEHGVMPNAVEYASAPGEWDYQQVLGQMIQEGQAAMWIGSTRSYNDQRQRFDLGVAPLPAGRHAAALWSMRGQSMSSGTTHPRESWLWLKFLTGQRSGHSDNPFLTDVPARRSVAEQTDYWAQWPQDVVDALQYAMSNAKVPTEQPASDLLVQAIEAIYGGQPVESALAEAQVQAMEAWSAKESTQSPVEPFTVAAPTAVPTGKTAITFAPDGLGTELYQELAYQFMDEHPEIVIEFLRADELDKADCFSTMGSDKEAMLDLRPWIEASPDVSLEDLDPRALASFQHGDRLIGLPVYSHPDVVLFNKTLFDQVGLPYPEPNWTVDEFLDTALALTQGEGDDKQYGWMSLNNEALDLDLWVAQQGGDLWDQGLPPRPRFDAPEVIQSTRQYADLYLVHGISPVFPLPDFNEDEMMAIHREKEQLIRSGRVAMWTAYAGGNAISFAGEGVGMVPVPQGERHATRFADAGLSIAANTAHPKLCWQWIEYIIVHLLPPGLPARREIYESQAWWDLVGEETAVAYLTSAHYVGVYDVWSEWAQGLTNEQLQTRWQAHTEFHRAFAEILEGADPEAALREAQSRAEERLGLN